MKKMRYFVVAAVIALFVVSCSQNTPLDLEEVSSQAVTDHYIVVLNEQFAPGGHAANQARAAEIARGLGLSPTHTYGTALFGFAATIPAGRLNALQRDPRVAYIEADQIAHTFSQVVPTGVSRIFAHTNSNIKINGVDDFRVDVDVAVIDTGIDPTHPDLNVVARVDCSGGSPLRGSCKDGGTDVNGHGTHVAGTIGALDNGIGVVGVAPGARLWAVKVLGDNGSGYTSWIIAGIDYVARNADKIEVANMSLGGSGYSQAQYDAIDNAVSKGVVFVVAAGNSNDDASKYSPAAFDNVITVSALADFDGLAGGLVGTVTNRTVYCREDTDDTLANFSNWGPAVDIAAPGVCINSTWPGGGYNTISGTSMASPHVAGAAALLASGMNAPINRDGVEAIRRALVSESGYNNDNWTDTSGDDIKEPLLDARNIEPTVIPTGSGGDNGGGDDGGGSTPCVPRGNGNNCK